MCSPEIGSFSPDALHFFFKKKSPDALEKQMIGHQTL
jgi:hypothetical protein